MARAQQQPTTQKRTDGGNVAPPISVSAPKPADVAKRAYELWQASGCAHGKDQEHWFQAERELRTRKQQVH